MGSPGRSRELSQQKLAGTAETTDAAEIIRQAWLAVYARTPRPSDVGSARTFLERQTAELGSKKAAVAELVRVKGYDAVADRFELDTIYQKDDNNG